MTSLNSSGGKAKLWTELYAIEMVCAVFAVAAADFWPEIFKASFLAPPGGPTAWLRAVKIFGHMLLEA
jgi:hypothetical protein